MIALKKKVIKILDKNIWIKYILNILIYYILIKKLELFQNLLNLKNKLFLRIYY